MCQLRPTSESADGSIDTTPEEDEVVRGLVAKALKGDQKALNSVAVVVGRILEIEDASLAPQNQSEEDEQLFRALEGLIRYQLAIDKKDDDDVAAAEPAAGNGGE